MFSETRRLIDTIASYDEYGQKMACLAYSNSLREAINKKKSINKDIGLKGGRGSIWKPNFYIVKI